MPKKTKLDARDRGYIKNRLEGKGVGRSALDAGFADSRYGSTLERHPRIQTAIQKKMDEMGLSDEKILRILKKGLSAKTAPRYAKTEEGKEPQVLVPSIPDHQNRPRYLEIACKMKKFYAPEGSPTDNRVQYIQINVTPDRVKGLVDSGKISKKEAKELLTLEHEPIRDEAEDNS